MRIPIEEAARMLLAGEVIAVPTETVYGLAACLDQPEAIDAIFRIKGRPSNNPLIVHLSDAEEMKGVVKEIPEGAEALAKAFWPGPLTLVLPAMQDQVSERVRAGLPTVAVRVPSAPLAHELLQHTGPLVMPSANLSGLPSATEAAHVESDFGAEFPVLDGGACEKGVESTILGYFEGKWRLLRRGALPPEEIAGVIGYAPQELQVDRAAQPLCPGQLHQHYAPKARLKLVREFQGGGRHVIIGFSDREYPQGVRLYLLGGLEEPEVCVARLYGVLRQLDREGVQEAWVDERFPSDGLWATLRERLSRAAGVL